jgi:rhodanese-related sulfurtransferase
MTSCSEAQPTPDSDAPGASATTTKAVIKDVSAEEFQRLIAELEEGLLIDVRTPDEWAEGHLKGAAHKDYWGDDDFDAAMNTIPRDRPVLVYCAGGGRSGLAANELYKAGHLKVYNLEDGITGWQDAGYPVTTGPAADF